MAIWNFGSQPSLANFEKLCVALVRRARQIDPGRIAHHGNAAVSYKADDDVHPTRSFFWKRSEAARFEMEYGWRRDTHMYPGWYFGGIERFADLPREDFGLVTEFGGQSLPGRDVLEEFVRTDGPIDWTSIALRCGQPNLLRTHNLGADDLDALVASSQAYQAELVRHHTEFIRSLKGAPGRGLHLFAFNDCWPSVTWSVVDYYRTPKPAYAALALAMEPVQAFLQDYMKPLHPGTQFLDVAIVNDGPHALEGVNLTLSITKSTGSPSTCESVLVDLPTDQAISRTVAIDVPFGAPSVQVELTLAWDGGTASNHYSVDVSVLAQTSESLNQ
jgi:beta-mannosidase